MADVPRAKTSHHRFAVIVNLMLAEAVTDHRKQLEKRRSLPDRNVEDFALDLIGSERGAEVRLYSVGDEAEIAARLPVAVDDDLLPLDQPMARAVRPGLVAAILLWMHNGLGYIYGQVSG